MSWLRQNLFSSWPNALATLAILWLAWRLVPPVIDWAFVHAVWSATMTSPCADSG